MERNKKLINVTVANDVTPFTQTVVTLHKTHSFCSKLSP